MLWLRWAFIVLNVIYCVMAVIWSRSTPYNRFGKLASASPYLWQLIGVGFVVFCGFSAWHLLWWFAVGYLLMLIGVSIMSRMGHDTLR
jgi:hypothetical protein